MNSDVESSASRIAKSVRLRHLAMFVGSLALVAWATSTAIQGFQNNTLIEQNRALREQLDCRARIRDRMDEAIGLGLVAVSENDDDELQAQAKIIVDIANEPDICT